MDCKSCKESREIVSRHIHESDMDRLERINKRWFIAWLITFVLLVCCVAGFVYYESQWQVVESSVTQEAFATGDSDVRFVGGDYYGGSSEADSQNQKP